MMYINQYLYDTVKCLNFRMTIYRLNVIYNIPISKLLDIVIVN